MLLNLSVIVVVYLRKYASLEDAGLCLRCPWGNWSQSYSRTSFSCRFPPLEAVQGANYSDQDADAVLSRSYCYSHECDQLVQVVPPGYLYSPTSNYLIHKNSLFFESWFHLQQFKLFPNVLCPLIRFKPVLLTQWQRVGRHWSGLNQGQITALLWGSIRLVVGIISQV